MHEVLAGDTYHPQFESVPEQAWSSAGFLSTAVHRLLGLDVNGEAGRLTFAPHVPPDWENLSLKHVRIGSSLLSLQLQQGLDGLTLRITNEGKAVRFRFDPQLPLGAREVRVSLNGRRVQAKPETHGEDQHVAVEFDVQPGESLVAVRFQGGVSVIMPPPNPLLGDPSRAMKVVSVAMVGDKLVTRLDVIPGERNSFEIRTARGVQSVSGAAVEKIGADRYRLTVPAGESREYESKEIVVNFKK
jgi:hypothetical protein